MGRLGPGARHAHETLDLVLPAQRVEGARRRALAPRRIDDSADRPPTAFGAVIVGFVATGANLFQYVAMSILFLLMMAFEAINTAIEEIVDRVSPEISEMGKNAKDLGSFACLCLIIANAVYAGYVVIFDGFMN